MCAGKPSTLELSDKTCLLLAVVSDALDLKKLLLLIAALQHCVVYYSFSCPVSSCLFSSPALFWNVVTKIKNFSSWMVFDSDQNRARKKRIPCPDFPHLHSPTIRTAPTTTIGASSKLMGEFRSIPFLLLVFLWFLTNPFSLDFSESRSSYFIAPQFWVQPVP